MPPFRMHEPEFPENRALYIIWCDSAMWGRFSLAAGSFSAMVAAWDAVQDQQPSDVLTLQDGARVLHKRTAIAPRPAGHATEPEKST